jgi:hypothetical protein
MRKISTYTPPEWQLRAVEEIVLFPEEGPVRIVDRPVRAFLPAGLLERLRLEHQARKKPIKELLEEALRLFLDGPLAGDRKLPPLPVLRPARPRVDLSDREALDRARGPRV